MKNILASPQEVEITALYFRQKTSPKPRLDSFPRRMVYDGREYNFAETGMQYLIRTSQKLIKLFDMNDGQICYRLKLENNRWTLISMKPSI